MDYAMPRAEDFCNVVIENNPVPTPTNPLGVKGAGEVACFIIRDHDGQALSHV
jgi:aerobic carbon-monoxide dehydrogenase large subunit